MKKNKTALRKVPLLLLSALLAASVLAGCGEGGMIGPQTSGVAITLGKGDSYEATTFAMGTAVSQKVYGSDDGTKRSAITAANKAISELEDTTSWRKEGSALVELNDKAGVSAVKIDNVTLELLRLSLDVAEKTGGKFDPTILPVSRLWNFSEHADIVPDAGEIAKSLKAVGYKDLQLNIKKSTALLKRPNGAVNLDAVGKGAGCDVAVNVYQTTGVSGGVVAVGGSVGVYGSKPDGSKWSIAVRNPNSDNPSASMGILSISSGFVSTSGTYEQTFEQDGVTYHHILDPETGYPAETDLTSATVHCGNGALSDALSTACILLGSEKAAALLSEYDAGGIFVTKDNRVIVTGPLKDDFVITADGFTLQE